tara:strand:+ start:46701 stop:46940 length:240 start_codon:yes stop_codon:yes gene_type:complete
MSKPHVIKYTRRIKSFDEMVRLLSVPFYTIGKAEKANELPPKASGSDTGRNRKDDGGDSQGLERPNVQVSKRCSLEKRI